MPDSQQRRVQAVYFASIVATAAYALLRLGSAAFGEPNPAAIGPSEHVPYFWRCMLATWAGLACGAMTFRFGPLRESIGNTVAFGVFSLSVLALLAVP